MLPNDGLEFDYIIVEEPSYTYKLDFENGRIINYTDGLEAVKQAIYLILNINRYDHVIYSWNYGSEMSDMFGKRKEFVIPESKRLIKEALLQDDRITKVDNFEVDYNKGRLYMEFDVYTIYGKLRESFEEVEVSV